MNEIATLPYRSVHDRYDPSFRRIAERYGFRDLYLIDLETKRVLYSTGKHPDLGTHLGAGPYRETAAGQSRPGLPRRSTGESLFAPVFTTNGPATDRS